MIYFLKRDWYLVVIFLLIIIGAIAAYRADYSRPMNFGVTFSAVYAKGELGLDWHETYLAILDDLKVDRIRLSAYWDEVEMTEGRYDFSDLDWQVNEAEKRNVAIILAVGRRLPRWPECHDPSWIKDKNQAETEEKLLKFVSAVASRYANKKNIEYFQVENEPYLGTFGVCPPADTELIRKEIAAVKEITGKQILVTDSGELSTWLPISRVGGDVLGTTLYRVVYNPTIGYFRWLTPPFFYWARAQLLEKFSPIKRVIVAELQAESWHKEGKNLSQMTAAEHNESMSIQQMRENIAFTRRAGFDEAYLWGAEWWYMMKEKNIDPTYWNEAKKLWANN